MKAWKEKRYASEVDWATLFAVELFPAPIDLDALDLEQAKALRTWFTAPVGSKPQVPSQRPSKRAFAGGAVNAAVGDKEQRYRWRIYL